MSKGDKTMKLSRRVVGYKVFGPKIDVTDPCYNRDIWCRKNGIEIVPGNYECVAWEDPKSNRVLRCGIYLEGKDCHNTKFEMLGGIGVDAGLAGFFENKPDYTDEQWRMFCESIREGNAWIKDEGFFTNSGFGDGGYPVFKLRNPNGDFVGLEIDFV